MKVEIQGWHADGRGHGTLGRKDVYVHGAYPGEEVSVRLDKKTKHTLQGRVLRLIGPSPKRIESHCPNRHECTGCAYLELDPHEAQRLKLQGLHEILGAQAIAQLEAPPQLLTGEDGLWGYRHFAKFIVARGPKGPQLTSYVHSSHETAPMLGCRVVTPGLAQAMEGLSDCLAHHQTTLGDAQTPGLRYCTVRASKATGEILITLVSSDPEIHKLHSLAQAAVATIPGCAGVMALHNDDTGNVLLKGESQVLVGQSFIEEELLGHRHRVGPTSFFQINPGAATVMFQEGLSWLVGMNRCIEGYAGVGALTQALAAQTQALWTVEKNSESAAALKEGTRHLNHVQAIAGDAAEIIPQLLASHANVDTLVLDPPRKGVPESIISALKSSKLQRILVFACDPKTLGRDLPHFQAAGYRLARATAVDQFPRTHHFEALGLFVPAG